MWSGIAVSVLLLVVLLSLGWGGGAWAAAAAVLLLSCIAVCVWAAVTAEQSSQAVRREADRLAEARRAETRSTPRDTRRRP
jgi:cytochrome c-type biogenesis protein CcmH/NrfG